MKNVKIVVLFFVLLSCLLVDRYIIENVGNLKTYPIYRNENFLDEKRDIFYVCWTGGFDSTYRICDLLLRGEKVQPIYFNIEFMDNSKGNFQRKNRKEEITTMKNIYRVLVNKNINSGFRLFPVKIITNLPKAPEPTKAYHLLWKKRIFSRPVSQYECIARYMYLHQDKVLDLSVEKCGTGLDYATKKIRHGVGDNCRIKFPLTGKNKAMYVFQNARFPIIHLTKKEMLDDAKKRGFDDILKQTWSCWFPINGKPCGKCDMCKHRVI